jgi:phospholipid/cholesterol/gamma-HCH transport system permease protein
MIGALDRGFRHIGHMVVDGVWKLGVATRFSWFVVSRSGECVRRVQLLLNEIYFSGTLSLIIIIVSGLFVGLVLGLQGYETLKRYGSAEALGTLVALALVRELGPVLAGLMVAGRVGSGIAAQLGSMRVTEQIDALNTLGTDPIKKLATPRVLASLIMLPVLTIINDFVGILGGNIIAKFYLGLPASLYWRTVFEQILTGGFTLRYIPNDFIQGLTKPFVFGGIISTVACYHGLKTSGGTEGVGLATTRTVVTASILILVVDYFLTQVLLVLFAP